MRQHNMVQDLQAKALQAPKRPSARHDTRIRITGPAFTCAAVLQSSSVGKRKLLGL